MSSTTSTLDEDGKQVAVIGAGVSGLVSARHLIDAGLRPTIYDSAKAVGGAWTPADPEDQSAAVKMWSGLRTNLSKLTCRFSDWPWSEDASIFPSVAEMNEYITSYARHYLFGSCKFQLESMVVSVKQVASQDGTTKYSVEWQDLTSQKRIQKVFDGVVVASGFFSAPILPEFVGTVDKSKLGETEIVHSSEYKSHETFKEKRVAVVGSSFSALEIAADLTHSASRIVSICSSVPWVLPRWVSDSEGTVLPIDMALFKRSHAFPQAESVQLTPESCRQRHRFLKSIVGEKQLNSDLGEPLDWDKPAHVAISNDFLDLVRERRIEVFHGRLEGICEDGSLRVIDSNTGNESSVEGFDRIICACGFKPNLESFLSSDILATMKYDPNDSFAATTLAWDTLHPELPNLGFCGMYRGPYFGIMELQARLVAGHLSGRIRFGENELREALDISDGIRSCAPRAQFPHFDYPGHMDELAQLCFGPSSPKYNVDKSDIGEMVSPAFYQPDEDIANQCKSDIQNEISRGRDGSRLPNLVLGSILGDWSYDRQIRHIQSKKVERVRGLVKFVKCWSRDREEDEDEDVLKGKKERPVLYREDGVYEFSPSQHFDIFREYEYEARGDALEIYFVEGGKREHLFLSLKFSPESEGASSTDDGYWVKATSDHLCIKDLYSATFRVKLNGLSASKVVIEYRVRGPSKDYESFTEMTMT